MSARRDYSFEALCEVTGAEMSELTKNERGRINAALAELRAINPDDYLLSYQIHERARLWHDVYPEIALTPQALTGVWSSIEEKAAQVKRAQATTVSNAPMQVEACSRCGGHKMVFVTEDAVIPCPVCNSNADASFWRFDGSRFVPATVER